MCVDTTLVSGHSPFRSGHSPFYPKLVLALCSPYESYQNQFWPYCPPIGCPMSTALLLGGPLAPYELCPPIGRPFCTILTPPNHRAGLEAPFGACADALAQKCEKFTSQPTNSHSSEFVLGFHRGNTSSKEPSGHSQPCSFSYANHI